MAAAEDPIIGTTEEPTSIDAGTAGGSARREHQRRAATRETEARQRWGDRVGGWVLKLTDEPQSTRAWAIGAAGEEKLAAALAGIPDLQVLHDRLVPRTRGNIDHIVIAPGGVFIVDAKHLTGEIRLRDRGGWFRTDRRLYVGSRDQSKLADGLSWQVEAVRAALRSAGIDPLPRVVPVLCFVDGDWPLFLGPKVFRGVQLESERSIRKLLMATAGLDTDAVVLVTKALASALPAK